MVSSLRHVAITHVGAAPEPLRGAGKRGWACRRASSSSLQSVGLITARGGALARRVRAAMDFIGIDIHKKYSQICVEDESGGVVYETRVPTTRADFRDIPRVNVGSKVLIEASTPSEWVARHLETLGLEVVVADPNFAPMYATRSKKVKTDKRDARCLADACRLGAYRPAHRLSDEQREVRLQADVRGTLFEMRTNVLNRISAALLGQGYRVKSGAAESYAERFLQAEIPLGVREQLKPLVGMLNHRS